LFAIWGLVKLEVNCLVLFAGLARALVALAEESRGEWLVLLALSWSDQPADRHTTADSMKKGGHRALCDLPITLHPRAGRAQRR